MYYLCAGVSEASEGVYRTIGECYDLPEWVYETTGGMIYLEGLSLQNGYIGQKNGVYVFFGGDYSAYDLPRGIYDTSEMVYETIIGCI